MGLVVAFAGAGQEASVLPVHPIALSMRAMLGHTRTTLTSQALRSARKFGPW